jgi:2-keto-4-pentenoate hydratase/2-oxohepta-3-ene-1,7-dioic acid hydratase in catechol pathway
LLDDRVLNFQEFANSKGQNLPSSLEKLIALKSNGTKTLENLFADSAASEIEHFSQPLKSVVLNAPLKAPPKIVCLGLNYRDHVAEQKAVASDEPIIFIKPRTTIIGPLENIVKPDFVKQLDYEAELAIVIGSKAKNVSVSEARSHIFGFTILNDVSARDIQFKDRQWTRGKSFDTFAPTGPCIVTADQLPNESNISIRTWVNGELRQNSTTKNMVLNVYEIVHQLSRVMTLEPCDLIATGTPSGVGFAMKPEPKFLHVGDVVRIQIDGIGILENKVIDENY